MTGSRVMALDYGERRMGVAVSDPSGKLARPLPVLVRRKGHAWAALIAPIIREHSPSVVVIGNPKRADGSPGTLAPAIQGLAGELSGICGAEIFLLDESLTTLEAAAKLRQAGLGRKRRRARLDSAAAAVILQDFLDSRKAGGSP